MPHKKNDKPQASACDPTASSGCCGGGLPRRDFLKMVGGGSVALLASRLPVMAGPFEAGEFDCAAPLDKKLNAAWLRALVERGQPEVYRGDELKTIGMPIGGVACGQLYLGGDGHLWKWDIFQAAGSFNFNGVHYGRPAPSASSVKQGFAVSIQEGGKTTVHPLRAGGFAEIAFRGEYPIGRIGYSDPKIPLTVALEAYTPYIPLNLEDSSYPATVLTYQLKNTGHQPLEVTLAGWLANAACSGATVDDGITRHFEVRQGKGCLSLTGSVTSRHRQTSAPAPRADIVFENFEKASYGDWKVEGTAFGDKPAAGTAQTPGFEGHQLARSFAGDNAATGKLTSPAFKISRHYITLLLAGGPDQHTTAVRLLVNGHIVRSAGGHNNDHLGRIQWAVSEFEGQEARIEIDDQSPKAHINADHIVFTDVNTAPPVEQRPDYGTLALNLVAGEGVSRGVADAGTAEEVPEVFARLKAANAPGRASSAASGELVGALGRTLNLKPGQAQEVTFILSWHFPSYAGFQDRVKDRGTSRRYYSRRFQQATEVAEYLAAHLRRLRADTMLWNQTWYDSTLPYWFLDRTFLTINTLATQTVHRFDSGRFWAWEGVHCCAGTCQHVWHYAQGAARIFPEFERDLRERVDFGLAWRPDGAIAHRAECGQEVFIDGFCGTILRAYREHQTAADPAYLKRIWPRIRKSIEFSMSQPGADQGLLTGSQRNTLDAEWAGPMGWISSLYIAVLRAGEAMAAEMGDAAFAARCHRLAELGSQRLVATLFNGEYLIHIPDPAKPQLTSSNKGCHIDQTMGQAYAFQLGLPRIIPRKESLACLESIWKYNFTPDCGGYHRKLTKVKGGRWYALEGEAGVLMTTFPKGGVDKVNGSKGCPGYFNEVWTGQEHQLAGHMIAEGLVEKGLAVVKSVHDRHAARLRNPYNEIECEDHYSRAMSSYGAFLAICGFEYHGPKGHIGFAPRLKPEDFKCAFTAAEGWGTYSQKAEGGKLKAELAVKWGKLRVQTIALAVAQQPAGVQVTIAGQAAKARPAFENGRLLITLDAAATLAAGQTMDVLIG